MTSTVWDWSTTASSNTTVGGVSISEGMNPANVNNAMRAIMAAAKGASWGGTTGGTANAQTLSLTPAPAAYAAGMIIGFIVGTTNTGATTLNVNSLGTKNLFRDGAALAGGELVANELAIAVYDGTQFQVFLSGNTAASTTVSGIVELATNAEALAGTDTTRAVTSAGLASNNDYSASGYQEFPGGLIIQWGTGTGGTTVTFPTAFPTACHSVVFVASSTARIPAAKSKTTTTFVPETRNDLGAVTTDAGLWIAMGY